MVHRSQLRLVDAVGFTCNSACRPHNLYMRLFILLLPWLELLCLIQIGIETSALMALGYVLASLLLGVAVLRYQGMGMFARLRALQSGQVLGPQILLDDMAVGLAGLLLIFPGPISDVAALVVLIGPLRRRLARWLAGPQPEPYVPGRDQAGHTTVEGSFDRVDEREIR